MYTIEKQLNVGKYTVISINQELPTNWGKLVEINGKKYETEIAYDLPNSLGIVGTGEFVGKEIKFI